MNYDDLHRGFARCHISLRSSETQVNPRKPGDLTRKECEGKLDCSHKRLKKDLSLSWLALVLGLLQDLQVVPTTTPNFCVDKTNDFQVCSSQGQLLECVYGLRSLKRDYISGRQLADGRESRFTFKRVKPPAQKGETGCGVEQCLAAKSRTERWERKRNNRRGSTCLLAFETWLLAMQHV
eukprot:2827323-Amphidinium_carterae.1